VVYARPCVTSSSHPPAFVQISWPLRPTPIDPKSFGDSAAIIVKLFQRGPHHLAGIKARRPL
jgi:hypothetical protein